MSEPLPTGGFDWLTKEQIATFDIQKVLEDGATGFILEVDLAYDEHLHDSHSDYPLAPESLTVTDDMLSPYSRNLLEQLNMKSGNVTKLIP